MSRTARKKKDTRRTHRKRSDECVLGADAGTDSSLATSRDGVTAYRKECPYRSIGCRSVRRHRCRVALIWPIVRYRAVGTIYHLVRCCAGKIFPPRVATQYSALVLVKMLI
ncbi:hypothetical protein ZHAS_00015739 [Anopheles sinensis]|uniref:Uncharacterized protein n=1 Tax=Anopheles sinensis TaxID=74873 RepID=A0A084WBU7_ANOSI|nr:hypothetical protein ZHAS_00015739 [Anopheles sinensis]